MSGLAATPLRVVRGGPTPPVRERPAASGATTVFIAIGLAVVFVALVFVTGGGVDQGTATSGNTWSDIVLTVAGGIAVIAALAADRPGPRWGARVVGLMAALTALEAISIAWSVLPDNSWMAADQMIAYLAVFAAGVSLARLLPGHWAALIGAVALSAAALSLWSLVVKVFPSTLAAGNTYGRLQAPFGYWNAVGLEAALGLACCLWLSARREAPAWLAALTVPALAVMMMVLTLSYSRSADLAAVVVVGLWLTAVPLRLRAVALLLAAVPSAALVSVWALRDHAVSADHVAARLQDIGGHHLGIVLAAALALAAVLGFATADALRRTVLDAMRRRLLGTGLLGLVAFVPVIAIVGLALSHRGLTGEISHGWQQLTNPQAVSTDTAGRVATVGSSRPLYWHEAITVGDHAVLKGVGELGFAAARLRYTIDPSEVQQAHSYVFETFADLGVLGLLLTAALLASWLWATANTLAPQIRRRDRSTRALAESDGLLTLAVLVVGFGVQSTLDWTWYFCGLAVPVLLCAGWLVGRGPVDLEPGSDPDPRPAATAASGGRSLLDRPLALGLAMLVGVAVLAAAWVQWRPLHAVQLQTASEQAAAAGNGDRALSDAHGAVGADPFSLYARELLATLEADVGQTASARAQLVRGTELQPANLQAWLQLGSFNRQHGQLRQAIDDFNHVLTLDAPANPTRVDTVQEIIAIEKQLAREGHPIKASS